MDNQKYVPQQKGTGALKEAPDERDYSALELPHLAVPIQWKEKPIEQWHTYGRIRDQNGAGACVAYTLALLLGIENMVEEGKFIEFSPRSLYARKYAKGGGMYPREAFALAGDLGASLEQVLPSEAKDEMSMRSLGDEVPGDRLVAKIYRGGQFFSIPFTTNTMDMVAAIVDRRKGVGVGFSFQDDLNPDGGCFSKTGRYGHEVTIVDRTLWKGKKAFIYQNHWEESWGYNGRGIVTEDDILGGGIDSLLYFENFANAFPTQGDPKEIDRPRYQFTRTMKIGASNKDVAMLQRCLGYLKDEDGYLFPLTQATTGYYGGLTRDAVQRFQKMYDLAVTGEVDPFTSEALNRIFFV